MYTEDDLLPLSALQHLVFCERQAALIHVEQVWRDNPLTLEGSHLHKRVDETGPRREIRGDVAVLRGLPLRSLELGLTGRADVVELHRGGPSDARAGPGKAPETAPVPSLGGFWTPFPIDYKRGKPKSDGSDEVQLCAQAICLEEAFGAAVLEGALFYGREQRRHRVVFGPELRAAVVKAAARLHDIVARGETPRAKKAPKCRRCSLLELCMPEAMTRRSAARYLEGLYRSDSSEKGEE